MHRPEGSLNIILTRLVSKNIKSDNVTDTLVTLIMGGGHCYLLVEQSVRGKSWKDTNRTVWLRVVEN